MLINIECDLFDIVNRVKEIDDNYYIVFNKNKEKFEVHYRGQMPTFCLTVPYDFLDARTVNLVLKTKVENSKKLFEEIDNHNSNLQKQSYQKVFDTAMCDSGL